jgi:hypothetical protein
LIITFSVVLLIRFVTKISSLRGQAKHLVGKGNQKTIREIKVPTVEERKLRPETITEIISNDPRKRNDPTNFKKISQPKVRNIFLNPINRKKTMLSPNKKNSVIIDKHKELEKSLLTYEKVERKHSSFLPPSMIMKAAGRLSQVPRHTLLNNNNDPNKEKRVSTMKGRASTLQLSPNKNNHNDQSSPEKGSSSRSTKLLSIRESRSAENNKKNAHFPSMISNYYKEREKKQEEQLVVPEPPTAEEKQQEISELENTFFKSSGKPKMSMRLFGKDPSLPVIQPTTTATTEQELSSPPNPSSRPSSRKTKKNSILNRDELTKELIQSRKVSRLPILLPVQQEKKLNLEETEDNTNKSKSNALLHSTTQPKLTKRRPTSRDSKIL